MTFDVFDVVVVPFPFTDRNIVRKRPAVILSRMTPPGLGAQSVMAMISAASRSQWPLDTEITDLTAAGLRHACSVRMKLFTFDHRLVLAHTGRLARADSDRVGKALKELFKGVG